MRGGGGEGRPRSYHGLQNGASREQAAEGGPGFVERAERKLKGRRNVRSLALSRASTFPTPHPELSKGLGVRNGRGPPDAPWDLSLNAAVEAWSDVVAKKGSRRQRDWQGLRQLRVSVLPRVAAGGVFGLLRSAAAGAPRTAAGGMRASDGGVTEWPRVSRSSDKYSC